MNRHQMKLELENYCKFRACIGCVLRKKACVPWEFRSDVELQDLCTLAGIDAQGSSQEAKADAGKPRLTLIPLQILWAIAAVRMYGVKKYGDPDNWKKVEKERYRDSTFRHWLAYLKDPTGVDQESGLPHLWHVACNIAFLCDLEVFHGVDSNS